MEVNKEIVGVLVVQKVEPHQFEIVNIAISKEFQNKGYGKKLIEFIINQTKNEKENRICICTGNSSIGQLALYQKMGFTIFNIEYNYFTKNYAIPIIENGILCRHKICLELFV